MSTETENGRKTRPGYGQLWVDADTVTAVRKIAARRTLDSGKRITSRTIANEAVTEYTAKHHPDLAVALGIAVRLKK